MLKVCGRYLSAGDEVAKALAQEQMKSSARSDAQRSFAEVDRDKEAGFGRIQEYTVKTNPESGV